MVYGKGKGGKGGKVTSGKSKAAPTSRSVRAGLQVPNPFLFSFPSSQLAESTDS